MKALVYAGVRGKVIPKWPTKHISASVASVVFQLKTLCFPIIALSRLTRQFFPSEEMDILPSCLFDKQKRFKDVFQLFNIHIRGVNEFSGLAFSQSE